MREPGRRSVRERSLLGTLAHALRLPAAGVALGLTLAAGAGGASAAGVPPWSGSVDVYRPGVYSMQQTWTWCTAASVQMARNIALGQLDHATASQRRYFDFMRAHNRYAIPPVDGVDPQGWVAGLDRFVDPGYRLVASATFDAAVRSAVIALRRTGLPVGMIVQHGNHAWLLVGFSATADPALTVSFRVTQVRVVGPLYGRQSRNGYDPPPDTAMKPAALAAFLTPFADNYWRMMWDGSYVTMQPSVRPSVLSGVAGSSAGGASGPSAGGAASMSVAPGAGARTLAPATLAAGQNRDPAADPAGPNPRRDRLGRPGGAPELKLTPEPLGTGPPTALLLAALAVLSASIGGGVTLLLSNRRSR